MALRNITMTVDQLAAVGIKIEKREMWYCNDEGPFDSAAAAALAGIQHLAALYNDYKPMWDDTSRTAHLRGARPVESREPLLRERSVNAADS